MEQSEAERRRFSTPYTSNHPVPSIQRYEKVKEARKEVAFEENLKREQEKDEDQQDVDDDDDSKGVIGNESRSDRDHSDEHDNDIDVQRPSSQDGFRDTSEAPTRDPKDRRKAMKSKQGDRIDRIVTDPVTHLPVKIHDFTSDALEKVSKNEPAYGTTPMTATGLANKDKSNAQLKTELEDMVKGQEVLESQFPPPQYNAVHEELLSTSSWAGIAIVTFAVLQSLTDYLKTRFPDVDRSTLTLITSAVSIVLVIPVTYALKGWTNRRSQSMRDGAIWHSKFEQMEKASKTDDSEQALWLNSLLASVWPLINPDLFTNLADTLEDVMQASLPSIVRMVSVDDIGQGSESLRILGIKCLPTGAAARDVDQDGHLRSASQQDDTDAEKEDDSSALHAEEGDFVNLELAFAYRASTSGHTFKERIKDMHIHLAFYLPGNIKLPIWVDLRGAVGLMRLRLQLAPDPPFFALCTMTLLGQPKIELSCVPLLKGGLNIMNLPLISRFVQSSIDAAMAEYVAPKSLTLNLKDMIAGDDYKKDVTAEGVLVVTIIRGYDFKTGDPGIPLIKDGSADPYVSVGWAKFSKPLWSTRILESEMHPIWYETNYVLVTPQELNVDERLRLQLWDSDRFTADDDLGRIEIDLKDLMKGEANGKMIDRSDGFRALKAGEEMPGKLDWRIGYFSKLAIQSDQLRKQDFDQETRSFDEMKKKVEDISARKLRETEVKKGNKKRNAELRKQQKMEFEENEHEMMISAPPPDGYPSGVFSVQIHQITGLELQGLNKNEKTEKDKHISNEEGEGDLPSAYCTIIINHAKVYMTRTKPKNARPFFNAGTERFIPDWRNTEVHISVRDSRVHEDDPLLGIVHLPLNEILKDRSQVHGFYPLTGGIGYGRIRLSMVWRSVALQAPKETLGWQLGTLQIQSVKSIDLPDDLKSMKIKLEAPLGTAKMSPADAGWHAKHDISLAIKDRYSSCLTIRFRSKGATRSKTIAFAILWLKDIPDEQEHEVELTVWKGDFEKAMKSSIDDSGDRAGKISVKLTFWSGLGPHHTRWAVKHNNMRDVVQVLETAHDNLEQSKAERAAGVVDEDEDSSDSDSSNDGDEDTSVATTSEDTNGAEDEEKQTGLLHAVKAPLENVVEEAKEYKEHYKSIHRRNRGIMTWKGPRTAQWAFHKAEQTEHKIAAIFKRHSRASGGASIETEV